MRTKEEKIKALHEKYEADIKALEKEYDSRFWNVPVNKAHEADATYILNVNRWHETREKESKEEYIKSIINTLR